jgi:predicted dithiol-disulfide oxidoreductase (DUF899 family)
MKSARELARELRAEANRLMVYHRILFAPSATNTCMSCKKAWPCEDWEKAQKLLEDAYQLEHPD